MGRAEMLIDAPPDDVFELLSDPRTYSDWVVGSKEIRAADEDWPRPGTAFDHRVGAGPVTVSDHTTAVAELSPVMLELRAHARPFGVARIVFHLVPEANGTRVIVVEDPTSRIFSLLIGPLGHAMIKLRNMEMLRRLKAMAEGAAPRPAGRLPRRAELHAES